MRDTRKAQADRPSSRPRGLRQRIGDVLRNAIPVAMICMLLVSASPVGAQEVYGSIQGKVEDAQGAAVVGATVELVTEQRTRTATTDSEGTYQFLNVTPGMYKVQVSASGFGTKYRESVPVELGRTLQVNFEVAAALQGEQVTVTASDEPLVDVSSTKVATNITEQEFAVIPKTLNFGSVINVAPGVRQEDKSAGFTVDGASGAENVFILDGVEVTRVEDGQLGRSKNIPFDFVREVQVKSAGYEAEYGGATGGVINVVTRSGQNDFHGEVRFDFELDNLRAKPNQILEVNPVNNFESRYYFNDNFKPNDRLFAPAFNLGGPIVKDKLWFYGSYAPQFERITQNLNLVSYDGNGNRNVLGSRELTRDRKYEYYFGRIDYSPFQKLQVYASFIGSPTKTEGQLIGLNDAGIGTSETTSRTTFDDPRHAFKGGYTPSWNFATAGTYSITDSLILSVRGGRTYLNDKGGSYDVPIGTPLYNVVIPCTPDLGFNCPNGTTSPGLPIIQNNFAALFNITTRDNFNIDGTYVTRVFGQQHIFKGGYQLNRLANRVDEGQQGGLINLYFGAPFAGQEGQFGYYRVTDFGTKGDVSSRNQSIFVQDAWQIHPRVTLNLGLRFENEYLPTFPIDATFHPTIDPEQLASAPSKPINFGWGDKIAPRIGAAWDVFGDARLKLYGSFSRYYDTMKYELPRGSFGGDRFLRSWYTLDTLDFTSLTLTNRPGTLIQGPIDFRVPSSLQPLAGEQPGIDPDLEPTQMHEITVGGDYAFASNLLFGVRFTRKELDRTIEDVGRHDAEGNEIYTIGNPGYGVTQDTTFFGPIAAPKAVREYTGLEFRLDKRFSNNWYANVTYLWSKLYGNYTGLASADEVTFATGQGRSSPNVNRYWDFPTLLFDADGNETLGRLPTDRPHTFKAYASYQFNYWNMQTDVGGAQFVYSGTPVTTRVETLFAEHIAFGRGDLGRTEAFSQTDLLVTHRWKVTERVALKFTLNVLNLWDERNESVRDERLQFADSVELPLDESNFPVSAYNDYFSIGRQGVLDRLNALQAEDPDSPVFDPRYNRATIFQSPRLARIGFGFEF